MTPAAKGMASHLCGSMVTESQQFDAANEMAMGVAEGRGGSVSAVEVQPEIFALADFGEGGNVVDGSGVRGASGGDYAERFVAGGAVFANRALQCVEIKLDAVGDGDAVQRLATEAEQSDGLVERVVRFFGGVNHRLRADGRDAIFNRGREVMRERQSEAAEVGFVASAGESAVEGLLPAEAFADPADGFGLDLGGELRARHGGQLRVERGDEGFGENSSVSRRWVHEAKVVGGGDVKALVDQLSGGVAQESGKRVDVGA